MRPSFTFVSIACAIGCGFSVPAATEKPVAGKSASEKSSPAPDEKSEETVPREFLEFADVSEFRGVIDDPDRYVNVRKEKRSDAPVITKVMAGEPFRFKKKEGEEWCEVKLKSGVNGWMDCSRIKLYFTKDDLPRKSEKGDEIDETAREQGINYYDVTQAAARGDQKALKTFFNLGGDGAAGEEHGSVMCVVIHLIGDDAYAKFLREQERDFVSIEGSGIAWPFDDKEYFRQHFPKSAKFLFPDYDQLIRDFTDDIRCNPKDSEAYRRRGNAEYEKDDFDQAMADFNRAIELDPKNDVAYWNRAWDHVAYWNRARVHSDKEEYDAAIKDMQKAIELQPHERTYQFDMERIKGLLPSTTQDTNSTNPH
jgi:Tetratricopeptide repeat/Bacterial SH3 domain